MYNYISYKNYRHRLKHYFISGIFKIMDLGNVHQIDYPRCMADEEANVFDANELKHYFDVNARNNVPKKRFDEAVEYAKNWKPCTDTMMLICNYNAQMRLAIQ